MITPNTPTPQHINGDELGEDDEVLQLQPKLTIHLANFNSVACDVLQVHKAVVAISDT